MLRLIYLILTTLLSCTFQALAADDNSVGFVRIDVTSKEISEIFPVAAVYPTETPSESVRFGPFEMKLSTGGAIAKGKKAAADLAPRRLSWALGNLNV